MLARTVCLLMCPYSRLWDVGLIRKYCCHDAAAFPGKALEKFSSVWLHAKGHWVSSCHRSRSCISSHTQFVLQISGLSGPSRTTSLTLVTKVLSRHSEA